MNEVSLFSDHKAEWKWSYDGVSKLKITFNINLKFNISSFVEYIKWNMLQKQKKSTIYLYCVACMLVYYLY